MPKYLADLDLLFHALSDGTRRAIVERLVASPASTSAIAEPFDAALPTILEHLRVLERAGIVASEKVGRVRTYQLVPDALVPANHWIVAQRRPQERQLDRLGDHLAGRRTTRASDPPTTRASDPPTTRSSGPPTTRSADPPTTRASDPPTTRPGDPT